jgi:hypothetical protein
MLASTLRNRHGSARLDVQKGYAGTPTIGNARSLWFPFHSPGAMGGESVWRRASTARPVQGRSELQAHGWFRQPAQHCQRTRRYK